jgi:hypothetical protein
MPSGSQSSAPEIGDGEIEHLVGLTAHHGPDYIEREGSSAASSQGLAREEQDG